jgi:hypothetical protein
MMPTFLDAILAMQRNLRAALYDSFFAFATRAAHYVRQAAFGLSARK